MVDGPATVREMVFDGLGLVDIAGTVGLVWGDTTDFVGSFFVAVVEATGARDRRFAPVELVEATVLWPVVVVVGAARGTLDECANDGLGPEVLVVFLMAG